MYILEVPICHKKEWCLAPFFSPTPKFFKTLRTIGLVIGLVGGAILASPVVLPAAIVTVGGYLALAGSIVTGVSQTAVGKE